MTLPIFKSKKRGRKGEGRATHFKPLQLPEDIITDLKLFKDAYSWLTSDKKDEHGYPLPARISFEQMLRHWMDNVYTFDPEISEYVENVHQEWERRNVRHLEGQGNINPFEYPVWELQYSFNVDGVFYDAVFDGETFICHDEDKDADGLTLEEMYNHNWPLSNDADYEFTLEQAHEVCRRLKEHQVQSML